MMVSIYLGLLILLIGGYGWRTRRSSLEEYRRDEASGGQRTGGPALGVMIAYFFPVLGLLMIVIGIIDVVG